MEANSDISVDFNVALDTSIPLPGESTVSSVDDLLDTVSQATDNVAAQTITVNNEVATITNVKTPAIVTGRFANQLSLGVERPLEVGVEFRIFDLGFNHKPGSDMCYV